MVRLLLKNTNGPAPIRTNKYFGRTKTYQIYTPALQSRFCCSLKTYFPEKKLITVSPPNQDISENVANFADGKRRLNEVDIEKCRFPSIIMIEGKAPIRCPREYDVPVT